MSCVPHSPLIWGYLVLDMRRKISFQQNWCATYIFVELKQRAKALGASLSFPIPETHVNWGMSNSLAHNLAT